jgi:hypothetical protein
MSGGRGGQPGEAAKAVQSSYAKLAVALSINAVIMFFLTYTLIATADHFYANINRVYMALIMVAPMAVVMLVVMNAMYPNKAANVALIAGFFALFVALFFLMRTQTPVGNEQFLRSMIPHHSSAILMCEQASITDPDIETLCGQIVKSQREEIGQMQDMLKRY